MEIYGFNQDGSINTSEGTVPNDPANRHRQMIAEWEAKGNTIPAYVPPPPQPLKKLYKSTFIRRLTAAEAAQMETILQNEEAWLRMLYHSLEYFLIDDALIAYLSFILEMELGADRAAELLAPEI